MPTGCRVLYRQITSCISSRPAVSQCSSRLLACHTAIFEKSGLDLSSPTDIRGGGRGAALVPGESGESLLFKVIKHLPMTYEDVEVL
jgi:hypothetical protein